MRSPSVPRRIRASAGAIALLLLVVPATLAAGPTRLEHASVDGSAGARVFEVTYVSRNDAPPAWVRVTLDGTNRPMAAIDAHDATYRDGVRYRISVALTAGQHAYTFSALDSREKHPVTLAGGTIAVAPPATPAPRPTATATPIPTPIPTPEPTPERTSAPTPGPTNRPTDPPATAQPTPEPAPAGHLAATPGPAEPPTPPASPASAPAPAARPAPASPAIPPGLAAEPPVAATSSPRPGAPAATPRPAVPAPAATTHPTQAPSPSPATAAVIEAGDGTGPAAAAPETPGDVVSDAAALPAFGSSRWARLAAWSASASTTGATVTALALFALRRRRESDASPSEPEPAAPPSPAIAPHLADTTGDEHMPRWRRPSLIAARRSDPSGDPATVAAQRLTFERSACQSDASRERRWIRYRMVRLSDAPDEVLSAEIGRLDAGDEVELIERSGAYWNVLTPTGHVGWVHRMTLGDVVTPVAGPASRDWPARTGAQESFASDGLASRVLSERAAGA